MWAFWKKFQIHYLVICKMRNFKMKYYWKNTFYIVALHNNSKEMYFSFHVIGEVLYKLGLYIWLLYYLYGKGATSPFRISASSSSLFWICLNFTVLIYSRHSHPRRSEGDGEGTCPPNFWKTWFVPLNKHNRNYPKLNKCIFRLHILLILDSHLKRNDWNGGALNVWQIYFCLHIPSPVSSTTMQMNG